MIKIAEGLHFHSNQVLVIIAHMIMGNTIDQLTPPGDCIFILTKFL